MKQRWVRLLILGAIALGLVWLANPPPPEPASIAATEFSAERAMEHVNAIAQKPHPTESGENARVRQYLVDELRSMGLEPQVQTASISFEREGVRLRPVYNILARLKGTGSPGAIMLAAHHDSTPNGPGAADDAAGVAALLETLRALQAGQPLLNDVILLITDGEENGLLGAKVFVNSHPWAKEASVVLNFEARGNTGAVMMFETSDENGWLIQQFAQAAPYPMAYSFVYDLYKKMPNDTDLTEFRRGGIAGLNFAMADGWATYHQPEDNIAALDRASLQHFGSYALSLTRQLGAQDLSSPRAPNEIFFTAAGFLVHYPQSWSIPLAVLAALAFVLVAAFGVLRKRLSLAKSGLAVLVFVLYLAAAGAVAWVAVQVLTGVLHESTIAPTHDTRLYTAGFAALALVIALLIYRWLGTRIGTTNLTMGAMAGWLCLTLVTAVALPGGSYLFVWPLLVSLAVLALDVAMDVPAIRAWTALVPAVVCLVLFVPAVWTLLLLLPVMMYWAPAVLAAGVWGMMVPQLSA